MSRPEGDTLLHRPSRLSFYLALYVPPTPPQRKSPHLGGCRYLDGSRLLMGATPRLAHVH